MSFGSASNFVAVTGGDKASKNWTHGFSKVATGGHGLLCGQLARDSRECAECAWPRQEVAPLREAHHQGRPVRQGHLLGLSQ